MLPFLIEQVLNFVDDCSLGSADCLCVARGVNCHCGECSYKHSKHHLFHIASKDSLCNRREI